MNERFILDAKQIRKATSDLSGYLSGLGHLWIEAFTKASGHQVATEAQAKTHLQLAVAADQIPWVFYDTVAELLHVSPPVVREGIEEGFFIPTKHNYEQLRLTRTGTWLIAWEVDPAEDPEFQQVRMEWYVPPARDVAPTVPDTIIGYIAGCVALLRGGLVLPSAANLVIAFESAIWDALQLHGIARSTELITYAPVQWTVKRVSSILKVEIEGADRAVNDPECQLTTGQSFTLTLRRRDAGAPDMIELQAEASERVAQFLATTRVEARKTVRQQGLTNALQRARKQDLQALRGLDERLDETLVDLRNNLVHLPSRGNLAEPIRMPGRPPIQTVEDLISNQQLVKVLLPWIIEVINAVYAGDASVADAMAEPQLRIVS